MKNLTRIIFALALLAVPLSAKAEPEKKTFYVCQYDGAHDSYSWMYGGEEVPEAGADKCLKVEEGRREYCAIVADANNQILTEDRRCGDENGQSPLSGHKAYLQ